MKNTYAYVGTMGRTDGRPSAFNGKGGGIYAFQFDTSTGKLTPINMSVGIETTMVSLSPNKNVLYSSNECRDFGACVDTDLGITPYGTYAGTGGGISAYALNCKTGEISFINSDLSRGGCTAYSTVSKSGKYVLVANHASHVDAVCAYVPNGKGGFDLKRTFDTPSVAVFRTRDDGGIEGLTDMHIFEGAGPVHTAAFIHSVNIDDDNFVYACNKGQDAVELLKLDEETGKLTHLQHYHFRPKTSPRHAVLSAKKPLLYVCNEMEPSVTVYSIDKTKGELKDLQTLATIPGKTDESHSPSDIRLHPSEKFLYVSNRSTNCSLACYAVNEETGLLSPIEYKPCGGNPRGFYIDPTGKYLVVGYGSENRVASLQIDQETGKLTEVASIDVPSPCSLRFFEVDA